MMYHQPALLKESIEGLAIKPNGIYVDVTFGGGGHAREILKHLEKGKLIAFDQDEDALKNAIDDKRFTLIHHNFKYLKNFLKHHNVFLVDGILADLGVSSHQFDVPERGFSYRFEGDLDLRMDKGSPLKASEIVNSYDEDQLKSIFKVYGELTNASAVASTILRERAKNSISTTTQLKEALNRLTNKHTEHKFFAKVFQALRIEVNEEMDALKQLLNQSADVLKANGRLVVISYHSLEDRLVKNFMKTGNVEGKLEKDFFGNTSPVFKLITNKPLVPNEEEIMQNNRSRSAKLRIAEKIDE